MVHSLRTFDTGIIVLQAKSRETLMKRGKGIPFADSLLMEACYTFVEQILTNIEGNLSEIPLEIAFILAKVRLLDSDEIPI